MCPRFHQEGHVTVGAMLWHGARNFKGISSSSPECAGRYRRSAGFPSTGGVHFAASMGLAVQPRQSCLARFRGSSAPVSSEWTRTRLPKRSGPPQRLAAHQAFF